MNIVLRHVEPEPFHADYIKQFRRVFRLNRDGIFFGWQRQRKSDLQWADCQQGWHVFLSPWQFSEDHIYYDGANCSYRFGWICVQYHGWTCKKCDPE